MTSWTRLCLASLTAVAVLVGGAGGAHAERWSGTTVLELSFDRAGIIEVESHALEKTIVQLEVE